MDGFKFNSQLDARRRPANVGSLSIKVVFEATTAESRPALAATAMAWAAKGHEVQFILSHLRMAFCAAATYG
jgi:hypothetical protein